MAGAIVVGTDTGVGKTVVSAILLASLRGRRPTRPMAYWKPFPTGAPEDDDARTVAALAGLSDAEVAPPAISLRMPASPWEAARAEGVAVPVPATPPPAPDGAVTVVEGTGGLLVPLTAAETLADAFSRWRLPLVVVARPEVGTLNHTLLTLSEASRRGLPVLAVVFSGTPTAAVAEAVATRGAVEVLAVPRLSSVDAASVASLAASLSKRPDWGRLLDRIADSPTPSAGEDLMRRDRVSVWHPYTQHGRGRDPLPVVAAAGSWLTLADGRRVLDGISSWWTTLFGHSHPAVVGAIARQAASLDHVAFAGATHESAVRLAERLLALAPAGLERVFYSDDGSTSVEAALKMALAFHARRGEPGRTRFLALEHGYHGDTAGAMSVSADGPFTSDFRALRFDPVRVPPPVHGLSTAAALDALCAALEAGRGSFAAIVVEPLLMGAGGMLVTPPAFLRGVRDLATRHGVLLVADEVLTGFGRTGAVFACGRAGVSPDLLCLSKALTGGTLPLAATLATGAVFSAFLSDDPAQAFLHGHSYTANPIACAAALAALDLLDDAALARATAIGERLEASLAPLRDRRGVREVRGIGLVRAVEIEDRGGRGYLSGIAPRMAAAALDHGVFLRPLGNVAYALPPLGSSDSEVDAIASALLASVEAGLSA